MGQQAPGVQVERVNARRLHDVHAGLGDFPGQVRGLHGTGAEIVGVEDLLHALGDTFEVVRAEAAVRAETFGGDEVGFAALREFGVVEPDERAHRGDAVLLEAGDAAVGECEGLTRDFTRGPVLERLFALDDQPGVLREAGRVEEERHAAGAAKAARLGQVRHRHRLPAAAVVGDGDQHHADPVRVGAVQVAGQRAEVDVALERLGTVQVVELGARQVDRFGAEEFDVCPRRVEMRVAQGKLARGQHAGEQDPLGGPALVHGQDAGIAGQLVQRALEAEERAGAGVRTVGGGGGGLLGGGNRAGARIGEQIDRDHAGREVERVVARDGKGFFALWPGGDRYFGDDLGSVRRKARHGGYLQFSTVLPSRRVQWPIPSIGRFRAGITR